MPCDLGCSWANIYGSSVGWLENTRISMQPICLGLNIFQPHVLMCICSSLKCTHILLLYDPWKWVRLLPYWFKPGLKLVFTYLLVPMTSSTTSFFGLHQDDLTNQCNKSSLLAQSICSCQICTHILCIDLWPLEMRQTPALQGLKKCFNVPFCPHDLFDNKFFRSPPGWFYQPVQWI